MIIYFKGRREIFWTNLREQGISLLLTRILRKKKHGRKYIIFSGYQGTSILVTPPSPSCLSCLWDTIIARIVSQSPKLFAHNFLAKRDFHGSSETRAVSRKPLLLFSSCSVVFPHD